MPRALPLALAALLLTSIPLAWAADGTCTASLADASGSVECTGGVPPAFADGSDWEAWTAQLANATAVTFAFDKVPFTGETFQRMLDGVFGVGGDKTVDVALNQCTMSDQAFDAAAMVAAAGSTQYTFVLDGCTLGNNTINMTGAFAAQTNVNIAVQLIGTAIKDNVLMVAGVAAVGATGAASLQLAEGSSVADNKLVLVGALALGGDGSLSLQLASSNATGNAATLMGGVYMGGKAALTVSGLGEAGVDATGNTLDSQGQVASEVPLVTSVMDLLMGMGFQAADFDLPASLRGLQGQLCTMLAGLDLTVSSDVEPEMRGVVLKLAGLMCKDGAASPDFDLASLGPMLEGMAAGGAEELAGSLDSLLAPLLGADTLQNLVGSLVNGTTDWQATLDQVLSSLLTSPAGDTAAAGISDLLASLNDWLDGGGSSGGGDAGGDGGSGGFDLGAILNDLLSGLTGGDNGGSDGGDAGGDGGLAGLIDGLLSSLTGGGGGDGSSTPGDAINSLIISLTGGADSPLAGSDLTGLVPVLNAVIKDEAARASLPALIQTLVSGGQLDAGSLAPLLAAVVKDPDAAAALPGLLPLLGKLGGGGMR